jgi:tetratricopeptide (TPR) repeat protein
VQRAESLAGLFYLLTLYAFIRGATAPVTDAPPSGGGWFVLSAIACALGMATKEVVVSAPLIAWLWDRTFLSATFRAAWARRRGVYVALGATWLLLGALVIATAGRGGTAGFDTGVSAWSYALTQCRAIVRYLALAVWPSPLVFDYGLGTVRALGDVLPQALALLGLLVATIVALRRRPILGFLGAWFFALLAPSSSFVPVVTQTIAEHRMYLALAAVVALLVGGAFAWLGTRSLAGWAAVAAVLGVSTLARNRDYRSEVAIWRDTAATQPLNARAHNNLGQALYRAGDFGGAMRCYAEALRLQPKYPETHYNLGVALAHEGRVTEAIAEYDAALRYQPAYPEAHNNLGNALARAGRPAESLAHYRAALELKPDFAEAWSNQGNSLLQLERPANAIASFEHALQLRPDYPEARYNLGNAYAALGRMKDALAAYQAALAAKPDYADAHVNAGNALLALERPTEALAHYERAIAVEPKLAVAHANAGSVLLDLERWSEAATHFEAALRLQPDAAGIHRGLGHALAKLGRITEAIPHYEAYLRAEPNDAAARQELAQLRAGRP